MVIHTVIIVISAFATSKGRIKSKYRRGQNTLKRADKRWLRWNPAMMAFEGKVLGKDFDHKCTCKFGAQAKATSPKGKGLK